MGCASKIRIFEWIGEKKEARKSGVGNKEVTLIPQISRENGFDVSLVSQDIF